MLTRLELEGSMMLGPVTDYVTEQKGINQLLLGRIQQIYKLEGFTGVNSPGQQKGYKPTSRGGSEPLAVVDDKSESELEDDDTVQDIGRIVDFLASLSI